METPESAVPEGEVPEAAVHSAQGGDTSNFQPVCAYSGLDFGYAKATEGTGFIDHTFAGNFANLKGRPRGAYHFYHPALNAGDQARFFWSVVSAQSPQPGDFLVADIEIMVGTSGGWQVSESASGRMNQPEVLATSAPPTHAGVLTSGARLFCDELSSLAGPHHPVLVYTNLNVGAQLTSCTGYGLIIAYPSHTAPPSVWPWASWLMWQWGAGNGPCGGDPDAFNGTKQDLLDWQAAYKPHPKPPPSPPPPAAYIPSQSGDEMFYFPTGKGATVTLTVPAAVPGKLPDGSLGLVAPSKLLFSAGYIASFQWRCGANSTSWTSFEVDYNRSPQEFDLSQLGSSQAVEFQRLDGDTRAVTGTWA